ncbi:LLM class flavin-dependent oxidoreductase [Streptomyces sp. NPDC094034]|uniref:LLM class flavin-dependent oxidoreductase n=1 Tax=Streptomyces sp. NPDC094034 TaxID=3155309 RepID=UPI003326F9B0
MSTVRFAVSAAPCRPITEVAAVIRTAKARGFAMAWVGDSQLLQRDAYAALTLAVASATSRRLAAALSSPLAQHPALLASAANTIAEPAPGRMALGLGSSESAVKPVGLRPARAVRRTGTPPASTCGTS